VKLSNLNLKLWYLHNMFICNCNGINERKISEMVSNGAKKYSDVFAMTDTKPCCGKCKHDINACINNTVNDHKK